MAIKRKDFQKTAAYIHQFLLKLDFGQESAEVRDALNLALLYMQKYYRCLRKRIETRDRETPTLSTSSVRGLSPMTPCSDSPDKFQWRWQDIDSKRFSAMATQDSGLQGGAPLSVTVSKNGDLETLKTLHKKDPQCINQTDCLGRTPLMHAVQHNQYSVVEWLLRSGATVNACAHDRSTALHVAASRGLADLAELLVKYDSALDEQDVLGRAPIHWAVTAAGTECLRLLLRRRADPRVRDVDLATPAMWACRLDRLDHFALLCRAIGPSVGEDGDAAGRTNVHWAVRRQEPLECLRTLLTARSAMVTDQSGKNVLMIAAEQGSLSACKLVLDVCKGSLSGGGGGGGASGGGGSAASVINQCDQDMRTAAHLATIGGHGEVLNYLLDNGADLEMRDCDNATIWDYAKQRRLNYCKLIIASHCRQRYRDADVVAAAAAGFGINSMREHLVSSASAPMEISPRPPTTPPPAQFSARAKSQTSPQATRRRLRSLGSSGGGVGGDSRATSSTPKTATVEADRQASRHSSGENWAETSAGFDRKESEDDGGELAAAAVNIPDPLLGLVGVNYSLSGTSFAAIAAVSVFEAYATVDAPVDVDAQAAEEDADPKSDLLLLPPPPQFQADDQVASSTPVEELETDDAQPIAAAAVSPRPLPAQLVPLGRLPDVGSSSSVAGVGGSATGTTGRKKKKKRRVHSSNATQGPALSQNGFSGISPAVPLLPPGGGHFRPLSPRSQLLDGANAGPAWLGGNGQRLSDLAPAPPATPRASPAPGFAPAAQTHPSQPPPISFHMFGGGGGGGGPASSDAALHQPQLSPSGTSGSSAKGIFFPVPGKPRPTWVGNHLSRGQDQP